MTWSNQVFFLIAAMIPRMIPSGKPSRIAMTFTIMVGGIRVNRTSQTFAMYCTLNEVPQSHLVIMFLR